MSDTLRMLANNNPDFIWIDSDVFDMLSEVLSRSELETAIAGIADIEVNIVDVFDGMSALEILELQKIKLQTIFDQLGVVLPKYIPLLKASIKGFEDETYLDSAEVEAEYGLSMEGDGYFPKLLISDGSRAFALMQVAACQAGVGDEHLRLWYLFTRMLLQSTFVEQQIAH